MADNDVPRCDACGPYTAREAAALVLGTWRPIPTGYTCKECERDIKRAAHGLADSIDAELVRRYVVG